MWRGPPLADLGPIVGAERDRLADLRLTAIEDHAETSLALGRHSEVLADLEALVAEHPLRERPHRLHMVALYRAGRQADALAVYAEVRRRLAEDLGIDPSADLRHVYEQILRQDPALEPARPAAPLAGNRRADPATFVGRAAELAVLRGHLGATQAGSGRVVLVEGEPGVGKTRLAEAVAGEAGARGFVCLWSRCVEGEGAPPLWPWAQVLRAAGDDRDLAALVPDRARLDPQVARGQLSRTLADLLRERAGARPLLLILDDLQWADQASLALLEFLAADLAGARILVLGTYREVDLGVASRLATTLGVLARLPGADRLPLRGLGADEVAEMIRGYSGTEPAPGLAAAVHRRTEGNPFFVAELLRLDDPARLLVGPVPPGVRDVVRRRVARLPPATRTLLDTASLAGDDIDIRLVSRLCGWTTTAGLEAAQAAFVEGLLSTVPARTGEYRFTHALVRETLAGGLTPVHRARLHERVALGLLQAYGEDDRHAAEVAEHLWESLPTGDLERTLRTQAHAAEVAWAGLAYERAEALLERASTLLESLPPDQAPADVDLDVHLRLGSLRSARYGYTPAARAAFDRARTLGERLERRDDVLPALWGLSATAVVRGDLPAARELTDTALAQARQVGRGTALATSNLGVGIVAFYCGRLATARRHFAATVAAWRDADPSPSAVLRGPPARARPDVMAPAYDALAACLMDEAAMAGQQIVRAVRAAEATGEPYLESFVHSFHARLRVLDQDRVGARTSALLATAIADRHGFPMLAAEAAIPLGWARAGLGEPEAGLAAIERGLAVHESSGQRVLIPFHQGLRAEVMLALGDGKGALVVLDEALAESAARGGGFEAPGLHHLRGLALHALGRTAEAQAALRVAVALAHEHGARATEQHAVAALAEAATRS